MTRPTLLLAFLLAASFPPALAAAPDLATYRAFVLGSPAAEVMAHTKSADRDLKTLHERPSLLQELSWRPPYRSAPGERDSVSQIVFRFVDNQLFQMEIEYDLTGTQGLTQDDMIAALAAVYGERSTMPIPSPARSPSEGLDDGTPVARWRQDDNTVTLQQSPYSRRFSLVVTSTRLEATAGTARTASLALDAQEAPAREAAREKAAAEAQRAAEEQVRTKNKATFKP